MNWDTGLSRTEASFLVTQDHEKAQRCGAATFLTGSRSHVADFGSGHKMVSSGTGKYNLNLAKVNFL